MKRQKMRRLLAMLVSISMILESGTFNVLADSVDVSTETLELNDNEEDTVDYDDNLDIMTEDAEDYTNNQINDQILEEDLGLLIEEDNTDDLLILFEDDAAEETEQEPYEELEEYTDEYAAGSTNVDGIHSWSGSCGDNLTWSLSGGVLTISGTGEMYDFGDPGVAPWGYGKLWEYADINAIYINEGVTSIGTWCFARHTELTFVSLPDTLREIRQNAFAGCSSLAVPSWPKGLKYLREKAFDGCTSFENVILPEGLEYVGEKAFWYCENLKHLKLPSTLKTFYGSNFVMTALRTIGPVGEGYDVEIPWETEIPEGIDFGYSDSGFEYGYFSPIEQVYFPQNLTKIPNSICHNLVRLTDIMFPENMTEIGASAFDGCDSLTELDLSGYQQLQVIGNEAFGFCENLEVVLLPDQAGFEYGETFMGCDSLCLIHLPETLTSIPSGLFWGCKALTEDSFNWPTGLTKIGENAFRECQSLAKITLPDSLEAIQYGAFMDCENLISVTIPAGCTELQFYDEKKGIFTGCTNLTSAGPIGDGKAYSIRYGWTENIPDCAFAVSEIKMVSFPSTLKEIGSSAFEYCDNLKAVVLPETLTKIDWYAFGNCQSLTTVRLPKSLKIIGYYAFENCPSLSRILFRGDMPNPDAYIGLGSGIFRNDIITAYYPANNPTWKQEELDEYWYGDDVTWKPYNGNDNPDLRREREASLNHAGIVKARFYLIDENGETMPEVSFRYTRHYNGIREEFDSAELLTDLDGSYVFQTPYLTGDNVTHEIVFDDFEIVSEEDVSLLPDLEFKLDVVTEPFLYTEAWSLALGRNGEFFNVATSSHTNSAKIELTHKAGGAMDLTLSITLTEGLAAKMNDKLGKSLRKESKMVQTKKQPLTI